jgi:predicted enzyme related to lactoylglutathione lyase
MVKEIAFCAYSVKDVPAAKKFYQDVLGLQPGDAFGDHWVEFNVGSTAFGIGDGTPLGFIPGQSTGLMFEVDNIEEMREKLIKNNMTVSDVHDFPNCRAVFTNDPEGNRFGLHQLKS